MDITYAKFHRWYKPAIANPELLFSTKIAKRTLNTLKRIDELEITTTIQPLTQEFLSWFIPNYEKMLAVRENAIVHDIQNNTLGNLEKADQFWCLELRYKGKMIGGTIFRDRPDRILTAYKVYDHSWPKESLQASPSIITDYILSKHAFDLGKEWISHGKDRNPYGLNAAVGLATFKLSLGYKAFIRDDYDDYVSKTISTKEVDVDSLIFCFPETNATVTAAILLIKKENLDKYKQLLSFPEQLEVEVVYRN